MLIEIFNLGIFIFYIECLIFVFKEVFDIKCGNRGVCSLKLLNKLIKGNLVLLLFKLCKEIVFVDFLNWSFF